MQAMVAPAARAMPRIAMVPTAATLGLWGQPAPVAPAAGRDMVPAALAQVVLPALRAPHLPPVTEAAAATATTLSWRGPAATAAKAGMGPSAASLLAV
jgi:hypothetical protein